MIVNARKSQMLAFDNHYGGEEADTLSTSHEVTPRC